MFFLCPSAHSSYPLTLFQVDVALHVTYGPSRSHHGSVIDQAGFEFLICRGNKLTPVQITVADGTRLNERTCPSPPGSRYEKFSYSISLAPGKLRQIISDGYHCQGHHADCCALVELFKEGDWREYYRHRMLR